MITNGMVYAALESQVGLNWEQMERCLEAAAKVSPIVREVEVVKEVPAKIAPTTSSEVKTIALRVGLTEAWVKYLTKVFIEMRNNLPKEDPRIKVIRKWSKERCIGDSIDDDYFRGEAIDLLQRLDALAAKNNKANSHAGVAKS